MPDRFDKDYFAWRAQEIKAGRITKPPAPLYDPSKSYSPFLPESQRKTLGLGVSELEKEMTGFRAARAQGGAYNVPRMLEVQSELRRLKVQEEDILMALQAQEADEAFRMGARKIGAERAKPTPFIRSISGTPIGGFFKRNKTALLLAGAAIATWMIMPKDDDNTIEGLLHGGWAQQVRHGLTEFGSGWDPLRRIAVEVFGGTADEAFGQMLKSSEFKKSLGAATSKGILGVGASGTAQLMKGRFRGEGFQFVRKSGAIWGEEVAAMRGAQSSVSPSVYAHSDMSIDMEYFAGKAIGDVPVSELKAMPNITEEVATAFGKVHEAGFRHGDPHLGNVMLVDTPMGQKVGLIDFGAAKKLSDYGPLEAAEQISNDISISTGGLKEKMGGLGQMFTPSFMQPIGQQAEEVVEELDMFDMALGAATEKIPSKFPAMPDGNTLAAQVREGLTEFKKDFGSRWDPMRKLATEIFGGRPQVAFKKLTESKEFRGAIGEALKGEYKILGKGLSAEARSYKANLRIGGQQHGFDFVAKVGLEPGKDAISGTAIKRKETLMKENFRAETAALKEVGAARSPSLYGTGEEYGLRNTILMEQFQEAKPIVAGSLTDPEHSVLKEFIQDAHQKGFTHTDLWADNIVRVMGKGKEEIAVLDWGLANRFEVSAGVGGGQRHVSDISYDILQDVAQERLGGGITLHEYSQMADLSRLNSHRIANASDKTQRLGIYGINALYGYSTGETQEKSLRAVAAHVMDYHKATKMPLAPVTVMGTQGTNAFAGRMSRRMARKAEAPIDNSHKPISAEGELDKLAQAKTISDVNEYTMAYDKPSGPRHEVKRAVDVRSVQQAARRNKRFYDRSQQSVGIGLRSASRAGKGHTGFNSTSTS